jgi:hypothetical protein
MTALANRAAILATMRHPARSCCCVPLLLLGLDVAANEARLEGGDKAGQNHHAGYRILFFGCISEMRTGLNWALFWRDGCDNDLIAANFEGGASAAKRSAVYASSSVITARRATNATSSDESAALRFGSLGDFFAACFFCGGFLVAGFVLFFMGALPYSAEG